MSRSRILIVGLILLAVTGGLQPAQAHYGDNERLDAYERLQGEAYTRPDAACDPADGQHTEPRLHEGERVALLPYSGCGIDYDDVVFEGDAVLTWFRVARNDESPLVMNITVYSDGVAVGTGHFQGFLSGSEPLLLYAFEESVVVPKGTHDIRIEYHVYRGPLWHNLIIDYIQWDVDNPCQNEAPQQGTVRVDGGGAARRTGWQDHAYVFSLEHYEESEGDPVEFEWVWSDGVVQYGPVVVRAFSAAGSYAVDITVTDDPVWRCITGTPKTSIFTAGFTSIADSWVPAWDSPQPGNSCLGANFRMRSSTPFDVVAGQCTMRGSVAPSAGVGDGDVRGTLRLDGNVYVTNIFGTVAERSFISPLHTTEFHTFNACFALVHDVYERTFCSSEYLFFNIGR